MNIRIFRRLTLLALLARQGTAYAAAPAPDLATPSAGAWQSEDGSSIVRFDGDRILDSEKGYLDIKKILSRDAKSGQITVRDEGLRETWSVARQGDLLRLVRAGKPTSFHPLDHIPSEVELQPFHIPSASALPPERIKAIQDEIVQRMQRDQEVRKDPAKKAQMKSVDADNIHWLEGVLQESGWIDEARFGFKASGNAVVLVKHSGVLPLMEAVLPYMEKDARDFNEVFAILYDSVKLQTGEKQRFGTQLADGQDGHPLVLPLEDAARVDEFRKAIGMTPLADYLKLASAALYDGKPIRMPRDDE
jgi:hypothetical protein